MFISMSFSILLAIGYATVGWQFWHKTKTAEAQKSKRALMYMACIFVLGGGAHLMRAFGIHGGFLLLVLLPLTATIWLFVTRQEIVRVVEALERDAEKLTKIQGD